MFQLDTSEVCIIKKLVSVYYSLSWNIYISGWDIKSFSVRFTGKKYHALVKIQLLPLLFCFHGCHGETSLLILDKMHAAGTIRLAISIYY